MIREELCIGDFGHNMRLLQNTADHIPDIQTIIHDAEKLRIKDEKHRKNPPLGKRLKNSFRAANSSMSKTMNSTASKLNSTATKLNSSVSSLNVRKRFSSIRKNV